MGLVKTNQVYVPKITDVRLKGCPDPPNKFDILCELHKEYNKKNLKMPTSSEKQVPDKEWCLNVLSILNTDHKFFAKDFIPLPKKKVNKIEETKK